MTNPLAVKLKLQNLKKLFANAGGRESGVRDISLEIHDGEGFSLLGPSGCGKTTTLRMIGGFEKPDEGRIFFDGQDITHLPPHKRDIRTVFQQYALFPHLNVFENIVFGPRMAGLKESEISAKAKEIVDLVEIPHLVEKNIQQLSGGEQQRVALARALITEPSVLLLDEPLSALDLKLRERMQLELLSLRKKMGMTFVFVTHDQTEAMVLSDRIGIVNNGLLEQVGSPEEVYQKPQTKFVASFVGQANFVNPEHFNLLKGAKEQLSKIEAGQEWMLRPESMFLRRKLTRLAADHVALHGKLLDIVFVGQNRLAKVLDETGNLFLVKSSGSEPSPAHAGEEVLIGWRIQDTWTVRN